jgi:hypothetical protein
MAKLLLGIEGNAANSNSIVLPLELPVNPACRPPVYLPKPEHHPPAVKPGTYRASGLVQDRMAEIPNLFAPGNNRPQPFLE